MKGNTEKIETLESKISVLKARKQKIIAMESNKNRKLLTKQKIIVGAYVINKLYKKSKEEQQQFLESVKNSINTKRKSDLFAVNDLIKQFMDNEENKS